MTTPSVTLFSHQNIFSSAWRFFLLNALSHFTSVCDNSLSLFSHQNIFSCACSFLLNVLPHFISGCYNSISLFSHQNIFSCAWLSFLLKALSSFISMCETPSIYFLIKTSFLLHDGPFFLILCLISFLCKTTPSVSLFSHQNIFSSAWCSCLLNSLSYFISGHDNSLSLSIFSSKHLFFCLMFLSS
jgi:hypothetical protein